MATISLVAPLAEVKPVPVTTSTPVAALYVADVMVGTGAFETVTAAVASEISVLLMTLFQSSAAARL